MSYDIRRHQAKEEIIENISGLGVKVTESGECLPLISAGVTVPLRAGR